jgi:hypothetical protein
MNSFQKTADSDTCIRAGFVRYTNAAAAGVPLGVRPGPGVVQAPAGVGTDTVAAVTARNYDKYHDAKTTVEGILKEFDTKRNAAKLSDRPDQPARRTRRKESAMKIIHAMLAFMLAFIHRGVPDVPTQATDQGSVIKTNSDGSKIENLSDYALYAKIASDSKPIFEMTCPPAGCVLTSLKVNAPIRAPSSPVRRRARAPSWPKASWACSTTWWTRRLQSCPGTSARAC